MSSIGGSGGSIRIGSGPTKSTDTPVATVQVGESKLSDLAQRLGVDAKTLQDANPHISDPEKLKVGQEINLPQFQPSEPLKQADEPGLQDQGLRSKLPRAPMGDSVARNVMKARLSATDLAQVSGGAKDSKGRQMKVAEKDASTGDAAKMDKYSESSKADAEKSSQKADDLAQVPGGAQDSKGQEAKAAEKDGSAGDAAKMDKYSESSKADAETSSQKADDLAQVPGGAQDSKGQEAKAAEKDGSAGDAAKMDKYSESSKADVDKSSQKADDLAQVAGGAQESKGQEAKAAEKDGSASGAAKMDKYSESSKADVDKSSQKADDLAQVSGGAKHTDIQQMKYSDKNSIARQPMKLDKEYGDKSLYKPEGTAKHTDDPQVAILKQKTASKASVAMDDYLKQ